MGLDALSINDEQEIPSALFRWASAENADSLTVGQIKSLSSCVAQMMNETGIKSFEEARRRYDKTGANNPPPTKEPAEVK